MFCFWEISILAPKETDTPAGSTTRRESKLHFWGCTGGPKDWETSACFWCTTLWLLTEITKPLGEAEPKCQCVPQMPWVASPGPPQTVSDRADQQLIGSINWVMNWGQFFHARLGKMSFNVEGMKKKKK